MHGKSKGNSFERKVAKQVGIWLFNDVDMVWRDSTSGGRKIVYRGDVVPVKAHEFPWGCWPFLFEAKSGYKEHIPTLMNQNRVREWLVKLMSELDSQQNIPMLVAQFHSHQPILLTTVMFEFYSDISLMVKYNDHYYQFFVYNWNAILKSRFYEICPKDLFEFISKRKQPIAVSQITTASEKLNHSNITTKNPTNSKYSGIEHLLGEIFE